MSGVYIVLSTDDAAIDICEAFSGIQSALGRAWQLAVAKSGSNPIWANQSPPEEKMEDGSVRWVLLDTSHHFVGIFYKTIVNALPDRRTSLKEYGMPVLGASGSVGPTYHKGQIGQGTTGTMMVVSGVTGPCGQTIGDLIRQELTTKSSFLDLDNINDPTLPSGWDYDNKPLTLGQVLARPFDVKLSKDYTEDQKWALAIARINKRPHYNKYIGAGVKDQQAALKELKEKTDVGRTIRSQELVICDMMCQDQQNAICK